MHRNRKSFGVWGGENCRELGTGFLFGVKKMFWNLIAVMVAQYCTCTKCH